MRSSCSACSVSFRLFRRAIRLSRRPRHRYGSAACGFASLYGAGHQDEFGACATVKAGDEIAQVLSPEQDSIVATYMRALADINGRTAELRIKAKSEERRVGQ